MHNDGVSSPVVVDTFAHNCASRGLSHSHSPTLTRTSRQVYERMPSPNYLPPSYIPVVHLSSCSVLAVVEPQSEELNHIPRLTG